MNKEQQRQQKEVVREVPPAVRFRWTIEKFSWLENSHEKLYSDVFVVGSHKWRVMLSFPEGNNKTDDDLSITLEVVDAADLPNGWSRFTEFSLAVVNETHNYRIKKDTEHKFTAEESNWGFKSFMSLSELNDPNKGYIVDDTCIVEVEVAFSKNMDSSAPNKNKSKTSNKETGSKVFQRKESEPIELSPSSKFIWRIEKFSELVDANADSFSDTFMAGGCRWKLHIFPKGKHEGSDHLSLYLWAMDSAYVEFNLAVLVNELELTPIIKPVRRDAEFQMPQQCQLGFPKFMPLSTLHDPANGYLANDACTIKVEISACKIKEPVSIKLTDDKADFTKQPVKVVTPVIKEDPALITQSSEINTFPKKVDTNGQLLERIKGSRLLGEPSKWFLKHFGNAKFEDKMRRKILRRPHY